MEVWLICLFSNIQAQDIFVIPFWQLVRRTKLVEFCFRGKYIWTRAINLLRTGQIYIIGSFQNYPYYNSLEILCDPLLRYKHNKQSNLGEIDYSQIPRMTRTMAAKHFQIRVVFYTFKIIIYTSICIRFNLAFLKRCLSNPKPTDKELGPSDYGPAESKYWVDYGLSNLKYYLMREIASS